MVKLQIVLLDVISRVNLHMIVKFAMMVMVSPLPISLLIAILITGKE